MNERINELYKQAHIEHRQEYFSSVVDPTIKSVSVTRQFNYELFAELIVNECLVIAEQTHETKGGKMRCLNDDETVRLIKEHFGVE